MRVPRDTIPEMRDFDESSRDESEPERDSRKGSCVTTIERTQNSCRSAREFRWFNLHKKVRYNMHPVRQPATGNFFTSCHSSQWLWMTWISPSLWKMVLACLFSSACEFWCSAHVFEAELRIFSNLENLKKKFFSNSRRERAYRWERGRNFSERGTKLGGQMSLRQCASSLKLTRIPLTIQKVRWDENDLVLRSESWDKNLICDEFVSRSFFLWWRTRSVNFGGKFF